MSDKFDPAEIRNPKLTLRRREREAGLSDDAPKSPAAGGLTPSTERDSGQRQFLYPPNSKPRDRNPEGLKRLLEKRKAEERAAADDFEDEFRRGTDDGPLTDSVRASRRMAGADRRRDVAAYEAAYNA